MSFSDVEITRYMSMPQFVAFLSQGLFIPKATMFDDDWEGLARAFYYDEPPTTKREIDWAKEWTYISCWYKSFEESMAMWHIYGKHTEAIAVHTSTERLMQVIDKNNFLKQYPKRFNFVSYMDAKMYPSPLFDTKLHPRTSNNKKYLFNDLVDDFYFKHHAFKHENEVRLCVVDKKPLDPYTKNTKHGVLVKNAIDCISMITLSPYSPDWYAVAIQ